MFVNCNRHSSTLAWKIPWTEKLGRLYPMGSQRVGHDWEISLWFHCVWKIMTALFIYFKHYKSSGIFLTTSWLLFLEKSLENVHYQIMIWVHSVQFSSVAQSCPTLCDLMNILLSHKKERVWDSSNEVDEPGVYYTEWSQKEKDKYRI